MKGTYDRGYGSWTDWSIRNKSKTDNLAVTEEANVDEAIPIYLKKERKKQAYKKSMKIDIEIINTFEKKNKGIYNSMEDNIRSYIWRLFQRIWHFSI